MRRSRPVPSRIPPCVADTEKTQKEVAAAIERTARQVSNLTRDGVFVRVPSATDPAVPVYPWPETLERWVKYSATQQTNAQRRAKKSDQEKSARTRAAIADAEMSEFRLQQLRGEWVKKEDFARELRTILGAIAAVLDQYRSLPKLLADISGRLLEQAQIRWRSPS